MKKILLFIFVFVTNIFYSQTFSGSSGTITDNGQPNDFLLSVSGLPSTTLNSNLGLTKICLDITHSYNSDLKVAIIAPDGTTVNLFSAIGTDTDNFTNTCLDQSATTAINSGTAPFTGTFRPIGFMGDVNNNQNGNGIWKLRITDTATPDAGTLNNWSITFAANATVPFVLTTSDLPIVIINSNGGTILDEPAINATMKIINNGAGNINAITDAPNDYNGNILIEYRGNYSQSLPQKPYKIVTVNANNVDLNISLLGMPAEHDWALMACYNDKVFMRNALAYNIFNNMNHYAPKNKYCEVVVNGQYVGVFLLTELIKRDSNRVDIARLDTNENSGINLTGGYILKNDYYTANDSWLLNYHPIDHPTFDVHLVYDYPKATVITPQQKTYIQTFINNFETALYSSTFASPTSGYANFINVNSFIDYFIVNELSKNNDGFKKSSYFYKNKDTATTIAKLNAGPVWDFDWAWKNIDECAFLQSTDGSGWAHLINNCNPDVNSPGWYVRLLQDPTFQNNLRCRWNNVRTTILSNATITSFIDANAAIVQQAQVRHFNKWQNMGVNTGTPEIENDPNTFADQIIKFKNWINTRLTWLDANIPGNASTCALTSNKFNAIETGLIIYPNPSSENFNILLPENYQDKMVSITINDVLGRTVKKIELQNNTQKIDCSNLTKGTYLIIVLVDGAKFKTKFVVE